MHSAFPAEAHDGFAPPQFPFPAAAKPEHPRLAKEGTTA
jgi:hypothetical protein